MGFGGRSTDIQFNPSLECNYIAAVSVRTFMQHTSTFMPVKDTALKQRVQKMEQWII